MTAPDRHIRLPLVSALAVTLAVLITHPGAGSELIDLRDFIGGLERGCRLSDTLGSFRADLNARYTFEDGASRLKRNIRVPESFSGAIGRARAFNRGDYTEIAVPIMGIYRGLRTRSLSFDIGHSNGISVTTLTFDEPRSEVEKVIGSDVAETRRRFETDPEEKDFGFSVRLVGRPQGSALICNTST